MYASGANSRKLLLRRKLTNLKTVEGASVSDFLQRVRELINELAGIGEKIADPEIIEHILMALPGSYEGLVNSVMYHPRLPLVAELTVILLQEDVMREIRSARSGEHEVLLAKSKKQSGGRKTHPAISGSGSEDSRLKHKKHGTTRCHYCGSKDHWVKNCPDLATELKLRKTKWERQDNASS